MSNIFYIIIILIVIFVWVKQAREYMDTDPGGYSKYAGQATSPFFEYDEKPLYGRYA
jgi:hypothetical protein